MLGSLESESEPCGLLQKQLFRKPVWAWSRIKGNGPCETVVPGTAKPWPDSGRMGGTWRPLEHYQYHRGVPSPPWCQRAGVLIFQISLWLWRLQVGLTDQEKQQTPSTGRHLRKSGTRESDRSHTAGTGLRADGHSHRLWTSPLLPPLEHHYSSALVQGLVHSKPFINANKMTPC